MPVGDLSGYRWRAGTYTVGDMTDTYAIESFPRQTDMYPGLDWMPPHTHSNIVQPADLVRAVSGVQSAYGGLEFTWTFSFLSADMINYLWATMLSGAYSAAATVRIPDERMTGGGPKFYTATASWPKRDTILGLDAVGGGLREFPIDFIIATEIT